MPLSQAKVKSVLSGDTLVLTSVNNPNQERVLSLAFVSAPRIRREGDEVSGRCSWDSTAWPASFRAATAGFLTPTLTWVRLTQKFFSRSHLILEISCAGLSSVRSYNSKSFTTSPRERNETMVSSCYKVDRNYRKKPFRRGGSN